MLGRCSNYEYNETNPGKAGHLKTIGIKPKVRGVAKNPVDHPHGGRTKTNKPEVSPWG
jgi:large subunit ribosomal protein L2